jgi:predicted nucleic-acid-binding protein
VIALDTNVLLRVLLDDDKAQAQHARRLLEFHCSAERPAFVNRAVFCEALWTLVRGCRYNHEQVCSAVELLLAAPALAIEDADAVEEALTAFRGSQAGFVDVLVGVLNRRAGCITTYTFDRRAAATPDFSVVD